MSGATRHVIDTLHRAVKERDADLLKSILADDVIFRPPTYWSEWTGAPVVSQLLTHVSHVFEDFTYHRIWIDDADIALEFTAKVGEYDAKGIDLLTLDENGRIKLFEVTMRPALTVTELRKAMDQRVKADPAFIGKQ